MGKEVLESFENDELRIRVYYDTFAESPNGFYDMLGVMLFTYDNDYLHDECDWRVLLGKNADYHITILEALKQLVWDYVSHDKIIKYLKKGTDHYQLKWNKSEREWQFWYDERVFGKNPTIAYSFSSEDLHCGYYDSEMLSLLDESDIVELVNKYGKDIIVTSLTTYGCCQGEVQEMFGYCTKERFNKLHSKPGKDWKEKAVECMQNELKDCGCWMWGNVYRVEVEEKVWFTKKYADGVECEDFEYRDAECGQTFYCEYAEEALEWMKQDCVHD